MTPSIELAGILPPSPWVVRHAVHIAPGGRVLDLACGRGRHARWLAGQGFAVQAVDRDAAVLAALTGVPGVTTRVLDLETAVWPLAGQTFDGVVVANYLWRPHWPALRRLLAPGGVLIYETFMVGQAAYGPPSRPEFLLQPGELQAWAAKVGLIEIAFAQGLSDTPRPAVRQALCARSPAAMASASR